MVKKKVFYKMPNGTYIVRQKTKPTKAIQDKKTGRLKGRKVVQKGDKTSTKRVAKDFVLVKKDKTKRGHVRTIRKNYMAGQIIGRG